MEAITRRSQMFQVLIMLMVYLILSPMIDPAFTELGLPADIFSGLCFDGIKYVANDGNYVYNDTELSKSFKQWLP